MPHIFIVTYCNCIVLDLQPSHCLTCTWGHSSSSRTC